MSVARTAAAALLTLGIGAAHAAQPWPIDCPDGDFCAGRSVQHLDGGTVVLALGWMVGSLEPIMIVGIPGMEIEEVTRIAAPSEVDHHALAIVSATASGAAIVFELTPAAAIALARGTSLSVHISDLTIDLSLAGSRAALLDSLAAARRERVARSVKPSPPAVVAPAPVGELAL